MGVASAPSARAPSFAVRIYKGALTIYVKFAER